MNNCNRLIPVYQRLSGAMVPARTMFSRRALAPWSMMERQMQDMDMQFARLEREMNAAFRDLGFPFPRIRSFFEQPTASLSGRTFPAIETETSPSAEDGKPGKYTIRMDVGEGFSPEDIKVSLKDRMLTIHAKLEKKSEDGHSRLYQEVSRSFSLPESINLDEVRSLFTPDGILMIEAPLPEVEAPKPKEIPISVETKN